jgi:hypothetical protein
MWTFGAIADGLKQLEIRYHRHLPTADALTMHMNTIITCPDSTANILLTTDSHLCCRILNVFQTYSEPVER